MAIELETAEIQLETVGLEAVQQTLAALGMDAVAPRDIELAAPAPRAAPKASAPAEDESDADQPDHDTRHLADTGTAPNTPATTPEGPTATPGRPSTPPVSTPAPPPIEPPPSSTTTPSEPQPDVNQPRSPGAAVNPPAAAASPPAAPPPGAVDLAPLLSAIGRTNGLLAAILAAIESRPVTSSPTY